MKEKLFIKIGTIVALLFSIVIFTDITPNNNLQEVNAAGSGVSKVQLKINEGTVSCTGWLGMLNMGSVNAAFTNSTVSGNYTPANSRECTDTRGSGGLGWALTIRLTGNLFSDNTPQTIATGSAWICYTGGLILAQGIVGTTTGTNIATCINKSRLSGTLDMIRRTLGGTGEIYRITVTPRIGVDVTGSQAPGVYTGVLDINAP